MDLPDPRHKFRRIKRIDGAEIRQLTNAFHQKSEDIEAKLSALCTAREQMKKRRSQKQIAIIWKEECIQLKSEIKQLDTLSKDPCYQWLLDDPDTTELIKDLASGSQELEHELLRPVWLLRADLKTCLLKKKQGKLTPDRAQVVRLISDTNAAVEKLMMELSKEEKEILDGVEDFEDGSNIFGARKQIVNFNPKDMGIPPYAWNWAAPNDDCLVQLLAEFIQIDVLFYPQLEGVRNEFELLEKNVCDRWGLDIVEKVDYFWDLFQRYAGPDRRKMALEFLQLYFADMEMFNLEQIIDQRQRQKQLKERACTIRRTWTKSREDLTIRIRAALLQSAELMERGHALQIKHQSQQELCAFLKEQVKRWRSQKAELVALEQIELAKQKERDARVLSVQKRKQDVQRNMIRNKVAVYKAAKDAVKLRESERDATRLAQLRDMHEKQARVDSARLLEAEKARLVQIREHQLGIKQAEQSKADQCAKYLESICRKVRPDVKSDPGRILSETESWRIKLAKRQEELHADPTSNLTETPLNTFTAAQLCADQRTRLTSLLHAAGLLDSNYARNLLSTIPSNRPHRKDNQTSECLRLSFD